MKTSRRRLSYLFDRYYQKTATQHERDELLRVIDAGSHDEELSDIIRHAWNDLHLEAPLFSQTKTVTMLSNILSAHKTETTAKPGNVIFVWAKFAAAAAILLFVSFGIYLYLRPDTKADEQPIVKVKHRPLHDALPGGNKAVLTLANGQTIILDNAQNGRLAKQGTTFVNKTKDGQLIYNAAAPIADNGAISINTITTPRGGQYQVVLPDGSNVWLNSASSLRFPTRFVGKSRSVEITGEAYFEVAKNANMPFRVKTNRAEIEVLGTHFNVMAYSDEDLMKTTLLEGAVNITSGKITKRLKPGQQAQINAAGNAKLVNDVDVDDVTAWKNGIFQFSDAGVDMILRQASRWYDVDITYKGKVPDREFSGRISRSVKASELLNMLKYTGVDLKIEGKTIIVN